MTWLHALNLIALLLATLVVVESLRREPTGMWPKRSTSSSQRRWFGFSPTLITAGNAISSSNLSGRTNPRLLSFRALGLALDVLVIGLIKRPTYEELERRARLLDQGG